jgi:uncharacterized protein (TIGR00251 family)
MTVITEKKATDLDQRTSSRLKVHVKTLNRETRLIHEPDGTITMQVAAPPSKGKANREIVKWLSRKLSVSKSSVRIVAGLHSNLKALEIIGVNESGLKKRLGI